MVRTEPLRLYQGDSYRNNVNVNDNGQPANLAGYTVSAQIRTDVADLAPDPPAADIYCTITGPDTIELYIDPATVLALPDGPLIWDLQVNDGTDTFTLLRGAVYVAKEVTV